MILALTMLIHTSNFKEYQRIPKNNNSGLEKLYKEILTMSSWWSIRHPRLINCLTTSKWPSADAFWSAVWPVWKKKKKSKLKKAFVLSNVWVFCSLNKLFGWSSSIFDHLYYCVLVWVVLKNDSSDQFLKKNQLRLFCCAYYFSN